MHWLRSYTLLMKWTLIRLKYVAPLMVVVQTFLAVGIVVGFAFLLPQVDANSALYLSTGAATLGLITVGMVLAPQVVADSKRDGSFEYSRTLPVPRLALVAADVSIWLLIALPGIALSLVVAALRFDLALDVSPLVVLALLLVTVTSISIGYAFAYAVPPTVSSLISQVIVFVALMFSPIDFPAERLPGWLQDLHLFLPFQYMAQATRETMMASPHGLSVTPFLVLGLWCTACLAVTVRIMSRRK
ncbi:ABC transporter permease [Actinoplanes sp. NPDC048796]|uniref:ABC transporter permease n=1 Tax=unclassified Actinoplanes TaxID=2626549 RepID=UPI0033FAE933